MKNNSKFAPASVLKTIVAMVTVSAMLWSQTARDPGVRGGPPGAGGFQTGLTLQEQLSEPSGQAQFAKAAVVTGGTVDGNGLGPRFNSNSCVSCHSQPAPGGTSPPQNPLFQIYQLNGATNTMPSFEQPNGPVLVPRFIRKADGTPDGKTRQLFTVAGRTDAGNCLLPQPDFVTAAQQGNLAYRQPLPVFGDGYIEILQNVDILNNIAANRTQKQALGIGGVANIADDGSVSRMGWKAQWRAILPAAGAEESTQMGISNEMFPTELDQTMPGCLLNPIPEDPTNYAFQVRTNTPYYFLANAERDADFIRFLAAPVPGACPGGAGSCSNGRTQFDAVGCSLCHTSTFKTPAGSIQSMGHWSINIFSDLVLHHMGSCLADGIVQGFAQGDMWRTPPLWNVGQRYFFLHDGRTMDIVQAIELHSCPANGQYPASEANAVIQNFNSLSPKNQQDLVNFLRSR